MQCVEELMNKTSAYFVLLPLVIFIVACECSWNNSEFYFSIVQHEDNRGRFMSESIQISIQFSCLMYIYKLPTQVANLEKPCDIFQTIL